MKKHFNKNLIMSEKEEEQFQSSNACWICKKLIGNDNEKVSDHCHVTGKFRGAADWSCNINLPLTKKVPGYDSHLIFHELNKFDVKTDVIPNGLEKYMVVFLNKNLIFIDSIQFMICSLEKLVRSLADSDFKYWTEEFGSKNLELLKQKGAYPYKYMNSFKKFNEEKLSDRKCFCSSNKDGTTGDSGTKLDRHISHEEYLTCEKIWVLFGMENMGNYHHDHYLKKDVLLLANAFEKFIDTCLKFYRLDSCHYFSSPRFSWDTMLKMTGVRLEKILDIDMYLFIEKGIKGGISYIAKRYAKANNKYMKDYNPIKLSKFITCRDMNNLYG